MKVNFRLGHISENIIHDIATNQQFISIEKYHFKEYVGKKKETKLYETFTKETVEKELQQH